MTVYVIYLVIAVNSVATNALFIPRSLPEDALLNFTGLSEKYGHKAEEHSVVTEDGYVLTLFHISGKRKPPVLLLHGIHDTADTYILRGKSSLAITLANTGYDVWAGNTRGNKYSRRHIKLNPDTDPTFWDYSFHEHGVYDLAAITDYVLNATGEQSLQSIGHSEGTTNHFVLGSQRPEYNDKFRLFIALAPVAFLSNLILPVSAATELGPLINQVLLALKIEELINEKGIEKNLLDLICNKEDIGYELCFKGLILQGAGYDPKRIEPEFFPTVLGHYPAAGSRKSLLHYAQVALSKRFALFDYGPEENIKRYGFKVPPDYNLRQATMKTALIVGRNDNLSRVRDVEYLRFLLPNIVEYHLMRQKRWNHLDFVWGNDMPETLFPHIVSLLEKYS
ncbi:lipase 1-like [Cydia pomonella]|uniref:lipase 1-like n=1 Tax=Cydia pomonella TaxID=82600 RepID=UPI002ADE4F59|nr:lipase 1-like [Cydia pomonella]